jgi:hypothetical protein
MTYRLVHGVAHERRRRLRVAAWRQSVDVHVDGDPTIDSDLVLARRGLLAAAKSV